MNNFQRNIYRAINEDSIITPLVENVIIDQGVCEGIYSFRVVPTSLVKIEFIGTLTSVVTFLPVIGLPLLPGQTGVVPDFTENISTETSYMFGINAKISPSGTEFTSQVVVKITDISSSEVLYLNYFNRYHTDEVC